MRGFANGYNPSECKPLYVINKAGRDIEVGEDITIWAEGENGTTAEVIRPY